MTDTATKSASDFGTHRKRKVEEFVDINMILLSYEYVPDGQHGPFYVAQVTDSDGLEHAELIIGQKYLLKWLDAVEAAHRDTGEIQVPQRFRIGKPGKSFEVGGWK